MTAQSRLLGGRYEIGEVLGYGGMAEVHRGRDLRLGRDVAIKMLRTDLARDATFQTRFRREAQNAASLNHPAIVAVYDTGEEAVQAGGVPYIVMEYVEGHTLKEVLVAEGRFTPRRACEVVGDVCAALDFSHRHQIIHRDVKPGNVMLSSSNQVKVMDFGIARAMASGQSTMTQTSAVIGTAQYLSPEQARGETVDARSDVYAVGCVLYELLCGHPPFTGDNPVSVAYQHVREQPRPPSELNPDVPPSVDSIVLKALSKNPANRYQSAGEMREDLLRAAAGRPVAAAPVMAGDERTRVLGATGPDTGTRVVPATDERKKKNPWLIALLIFLVLLLVAGLGYAAYALSGGGGDDPPPPVVVPQVVGEEQAAAEQMLTDAGLTFTVETEEVTDMDQDGKVIDQDPQAESEVEANTEVTITVGVLPGDIPVPNIDDYTNYDAFESELDRLGLVGVTEEVADSSEAGTMLDQDPDAGTEIGFGEEVTVQISDGSLTYLPNVTGESEEDARSTLEDADFQVNVEYEVDPSATLGTVISQSPDGDTDQASGTSVTIVVAGVEVPNVEGADVGTARSLIEGAGLGFDAGEAEDNYVVVSQEPGPNEIVSPDETVGVESEPPDNGLPGT